MDKIDNNDTTPPAERLNNLINGALITKLLAISAQLSLADRLAAGPKDVDTLARETGMNADSLYRTLRALASHGVFAETDPRTFALTPTAELLRSDVPGSQRLWAIFNGARFYWDSIGHAEHSLRTGEPSFSELYRQSTFDFYNSDPEAGPLFYDMMTQMTAELLPLVLENYDFSRHDHVVDVGGGHGSLLWATMETHPELKGTLFDLPPVIDHAAKAMMGSPLRERARLIDGDFFEKVPEGGDAYLLKYIIHDWDDEACVRILENCRKAMTGDGRVLVVENVLAPGNRPCSGKMLDLTMLLLEKGRERTADEFEQLFARAGLSLERIRPIAGSMCIVEGVPAG